MYKVELLGSDHIGCQTLIRGTLRRVKRIAHARNLKHWAIYRTMYKGRRFHNATDSDFLIEHHDDPYWLNRGVAST